MIRTHVAAVALAATWVLIAAGCATDPDSTQSPELSSSEVRSLSEATCGAVVFSSIEPDLDEFPPLDADAQGALDELVSGPTGIEAEGFDSDFRWSIASRDNDRLVLFGQGGTTNTPIWAQVQFGRDSGAWTPIAWGGCEILVEAPGFGPAFLAVDPERPTDPASNEVPVVINERSCASGQAPDDRAVVPHVDETDQAVTITVLVEHVQGSAECPENPWHPITVTLQSPLGSRELLDGHAYPVQPVGPPTDPN